MSLLIDTVAAVVAVVVAVVAVTVVVAVADVAVVAAVVDANKSRTILYNLLWRPAVF